MKKFLFFLYVIGFLVLGSFLVSAGTLTLTTYYPAPNGNYNHLTANNIGVGTNPTTSANALEISGPTHSNSTVTVNNAAAGYAVTINETGVAGGTTGLSVTDKSSVVTNVGTNNGDSIEATGSINTTHDIYTTGVGSDISNRGGGTIYSTGGDIYTSVAGAIYTLGSGNLSTKGTGNITSAGAITAGGAAAGAAGTITATSTISTTGGNISTTAGSISNAGVFNGTSLSVSGAISGGAISGSTLTTSGNIQCSGVGCTITAASDESLKQNIMPITGALDKVERLNGVTFNWKQTGAKDIGVVAQNVEKVLPEIVHTFKNGNKGVEYGNLVALLIEGMKEQQKEIKDQQKEIEALEKKLGRTKS